MHLVSAFSSANLLRPDYLISSRMVQDVPISSKLSGFLGIDCELKLAFPIHIFDPANVEPMSYSRVCTVLPVNFSIPPGCVLFDSRRRALLKALLRTVPIETCM